MYNAIIYSTDLKIVKKACNIIFNNFDNIHLLGVVGSKEELSNMCNNSKINMIILDFNIEISEIQYLLQNIENKIIFSKNPQTQKNSKYTLYLPIDETNEYLLKKLENFISKINKRVIHKKVYEVLKNLRFDFKLLGTNYLVDAIVYSYIHKDNYQFENLKKYVYPHVSKIYNVNSHNVKYAITRSIDNMNIHPTPSEYKKHYFGFYERVTPKLLISTIVNKL